LWDGIASKRSVSSSPLSKLEVKVLADQRGHVQLRIVRDLARVMGIPSFRSLLIFDRAAGLGLRGYISRGGGGECACGLEYEASC
jgi:hypothetical protein